MADEKRDPWNTKKDPWGNSPSWGKGESKRDSWNDRGESGSKTVWLLVGAGLVAVALLFIFVIRPAYQGYAIYSALDGNIPENYVTDMQGLTQDKAAAETAAQAAQDAVRAKERELAVAAGSLESCQEQYDSCNAELTKARKLKDDVTQSFSNDLSQAKQDLATCQEDLKSAKDAESAVIADAARRICCIQRVENPAVNSFNIVDGRIVCATDGEKQISC